MRNGHDEIARGYNRRGFLGLSLGAAVPATFAGSSRSITGASAHRMPLLAWRLDRMEVLGIPEDWSAVRLGLHPFAPERTLVLPSDERLRYAGRPGGRDCGRIEQQLAERGYEPPPLPREKLDAIYWIVDGLTGHYHRPDLFEDWAAGLAGRESLASTGFGGHLGLAHQFQGRSEVQVDCPPLDWWLILCPDGIDWASLDGEPVHALLAHVGQVPWQVGTRDVLLRAWCLSARIAKDVNDWRRVSRMGRLSAVRYLNPIAARALEAMDD
jgi:hypothetical protein